MLTRNGGIVFTPSGQVRAVLGASTRAWLMAEEARQPAKPPAAAYSDRRSLLFGLHGLTFDESSGARSTEGADFAASTDEVCNADLEP